MWLFTRVYISLRRWMMKHIVIRDPLIVGEGWMVNYVIYMTDAIKNTPISSPIP